jgi:hypothetical protein
MTTVQEPIRSADGTDITDAVRIVYDLAHSSMNWGSGMLDGDEMRAVIDLAIHMGWKVPDIGDCADGPAVEIARDYPEHYEITSRPSQWRPGGLMYVIRSRS